MEYETDEEVLHYDEASNSGSSDGVISESDNEISFDEPEPITPHLHLTTLSPFPSSSC